MTGAEATFFLSPKITLLPILHGSGDFAQEIRDFLVSTRLDCLAVPLPASVEQVVEGGITQLPSISLAVIPEIHQHNEPTQTYIPIDPCQAVIMGIRFAMGEGIDRAYIDRDVKCFEHVIFPLPDSYAVKHVSLSAFVAGVLPFLPYPKPNSQWWHRVSWMAFKLHELELEYKSIVCLCNVQDWPWLRDAYLQRCGYTEPERLDGPPFLCSVRTSQLYFALCELPFLTELSETRRLEARSDRYLSIDGIKELLLETRIRWRAKRSPDLFQEDNWVTPKLLQMYLQYVRNLSLLENTLTPDLYTLVVAAKQLAGDEFAMTLLETAKSYVFQDSNDQSISLPQYRIGINQLEASNGEITRAKNRLQGRPLFWRPISLLPTPSKIQKQNWAYRWNPYGQCSWPPEDDRIERFAAHVREQGKFALGNDLARVEKFTASFRDGIDLRETFKNYNPKSGQPFRDIYVKDLPPSRGDIDVVVFLFEVPADPDKFSWKTTWYAEHDQESTVCFYATPYLDHMTGPGIGQSRYGGMFFLYPPRPIPDIWEDPRLNFTDTLEERLIAGAAANSLRPSLTVVSPGPLRSQWKHIARRFRRRIIPIALSTFSGQTISRLRCFHVLNGHNVRSFASRFIQG